MTDKELLDWLESKPITTLEKTVTYADTGYQTYLERTHWRVVNMYGEEFNGDTL